MPTTIKTSITVTGSFDPDVFSRAVSLTPTHSARAGDPRGRSTVLRYSEDSWRIIVDNRPSLHIDEELDRLLAILGPASAKFRETLRSMGLSAEATFGVRVEDGQVPSISLSSDQIKRLADLGMSIDIDII